VLVAIFEVKLMLAHENSGYSQTARGGSNSDDLGKVELGLVEKEVGLSGSEIRKIWSEYIVQKKKTTRRNSDQISMISNEHGQAVKRGVSNLLWTRGAMKRKAEGEDKSTHYRQRLDENGKLWSVPDMVTAISEVNNRLGQVYIGTSSATTFVLNI
jgi:hypothetical protein